MRVIYLFDIKVFIFIKYRKILLLIFVRVFEEGDYFFKVVWIVIGMVRFKVRFWICIDFLILKIVFNL